MNAKVKRVKEEIFRRYPQAVINYEYPHGEVLFWTSPHIAATDYLEVKLHSGYIERGKFRELIDF